MTNTKEFTVNMTLNKPKEWEEKVKEIANEIVKEVFEENKRLRTENATLRAENERLTAENEKLKNRHTKLWNALDFLASKENYEDGVDHTILFVNDEDGWFHPANFALQALEEDKNE